MECLTIELSLIPKLVVCCVYVPPNSADDYQCDLLSYLEKLPRDSDLVLLGDFNAPDVEWSSFTANLPFSRKLCNFACKLNLIQVVQQPTHHHGNTLDLVFTNNSDRLSNVVVSQQEAPLSDHYFISFSITSKLKSKNSRHDAPHQIFLFSAVNYFDVDDYLASAFFDYSSVNSLWSSIKYSIFSACNLFVPKKTIRPNSYPPWFNSVIRHKLNVLRSLRRSFRHLPTPHKSHKIDSLEQAVSSEISSAKKLYESTLITKFSSNPKRLYQHLKSMNKSRFSPDVLIVNSNPVTDPLAKSEIFNKFFNSTFTHSIFSLPPVESLPTPAQQLHTVSIEVSDVFECLSSLDVTKAPGCDNINPRLLKHCATSLVTPITNLLQESIRLCTLPEEWKVHKIRPIHKKGDPTNVSNYRPISLLCILSKLLESIIYSKVIAFIRPRLSHKQFGFLRNRSSLLQLLLSYSEVFKSLDTGTPTDGIYLDFSKAFDTVSHNELLVKLWMIGITGPLWFWFKDYLSLRTHFVSIDNVCSSHLPVISGVPQGSILGPLLFIIYINDLPLTIARSSVFVFADDTKLFKPITGLDCSNELQADISDIKNWCRTWKLSLNSSKCVALRFTNKSPPELSPYSVENTKLEFALSHRDLGITISHNLTWSNHFKVICSKAYSALALIRRTFSNHSAVSTKKQLYLSLVRSQFSYCSQIWRPHLACDIKRLEQVQRRATKFILNDYSSSYKARLVHLQLLPLMHWFEFLDIMFLIKCIKDPPDNFNIFEFIQFVSSSTRSGSNNKLVISLTCSSKVRHFYFNRIARLWNRLPHIDLSLSLLAIKHNIYSILWQNFVHHFESDSTCTFHLVCPCNNCHLSGR